MPAQQILVLSIYYPPDLCAGSFRTGALVEALLETAPDLKVDVLTTLPNRYHSFTREAPEEESDGRCSIKRIRLPAHHSQIFDQTRAFAHFARSVSRHLRGRQYDLVYATTSRLMTGALGARMARRLGAPMYLDVRDIFVDTLREIVPGVVALPLGPVFSAIERWTITRAAHVNLVSEGFAGYFKARYPDRSFSYFTNGIDEEFLHVQLPVRRESGRPVVVLCAGNIGQGQGLERIIPAAAKRLDGRVQFKVIGDGGRRPQLEQALAESGVRNVELLPPVTRRALIQEYGAADVLFLHLNDYDAFKKVLPSKIFEYAALGKPIWAGVAGHAAEFLAAEVSNAAVFQPCDVDGAIAAFNRLELRDAPRESFVRKYRRTEIMRRMADDVMRFVKR